MWLVDCIIHTASHSEEGPCALTAVTLKGVEAFEAVCKAVDVEETAECAAYTRLMHSSHLDTALGIIDHFGCSLLIL